MADERKTDQVTEAQDPSDIPAGSMLLEEAMELLQEFESGGRKAVGDASETDIHTSGNRNL